MCNCWANRGIFFYQRALSYISYTGKTYLIPFLLSFHVVMVKIVKFSLMIMQLCTVNSVSFHRIIRVNLSVWNVFNQKMKQCKIWSETGNNQGISVVNKWRTDEFKVHEVFLLFLLSRNSNHSWQKKTYWYHKKIWPKGMATNKRGLTHHGIVSWTAHRHS